MLCFEFCMGLLCMQEKEPREDQGIDPTKYTAEQTVQHDVIELQPWPPPCSLRTCCLSGKGVVLWTLVRWMRPAGWQEGQGYCSSSRSRAGEGREKSLLGNSIVLGSLGLKESNSLGSHIVLGKVNGLSIHYTRMTCT